MKLLDRYILIQFCRNLLLILSGIVTIYLFVDFFDRIDNFIEAQKAITLAVKYFFFKIPFMADQLLPVCILLSSIITLGLMNRSNELIAFQATGISVARIVRPIIVGAFLVTLFNLAMVQWLLPATLSVTNRIWYEEVTKNIPKGIEREGRTYHKGREGLYTFKRPDPKKNEFVNFSYISWDENHDLKFLFSAETASWHDKRWSFTDGQIKKKTGENAYSVELFDAMSFSLPETPVDFFVPFYKVKEKTLSELYHTATKSGEYQNRYAWLDFHQRLSFILLAVPLVLIGIPILLIVTRRFQRDLSLAAPISFGLVFIAWGAWSTMQSMSRTEYLNPVLASWSIHVVVSVIGFMLLRQQNR